jgi:beta-N-acetylhexosaminidase
VIDVGVSDVGEDAFGSRVYSDDPREVAAYATAAVGEYRRAKLFVAPEHFPGLGSANQPTEEGPAQVGQSLGELRARDLAPFRAAFRAGADGVLLSSGAYAADDGVTPGSVSPKVATDLLRRSEGFRGVAITDDLADPAVSVNYSAPAAAVAALRAGADAVYISGSARDQQAAYKAVLRAARRKRISRARLDEALLRILMAKRKIGLIR